ncbi:hypothetical protein JMUB7526_28450 [Staphylococcus aureus]
MTFEEKLSQMYNEIANEISGMIPVEWEKVYTIAYVDDEGGEVVFNYTKPGSEDLNYYSDIPKDCNVSKDIFKNSWFKVYRMFDELRETSVSYTHLRAHETCADLVCRLLLEKIL